MIHYLKYMKRHNKGIEKKNNEKEYLDNWGVDKKTSIQIPRKDERKIQFQR